jgi:DHA2 family multidrug resistance protein
MRSNFNTQADFKTIMIPTIIQGVAMAFFFIPLVTITLSGISPEKIPAASGLSNFVRITAGSFGTSIATTIWQDRAAMHHAQISEYVNQGSVATNSALTGLAAAGLTPDQALGTINRLADQQAYMLAANDVFYVSALIFLLLIPMVFLTRPTHAGAGVRMRRLGRTELRLDRLKKRRFGRLFSFAIKSAAAYTRFYWLSGQLHLSLT